MSIQIKSASINKVLLGLLMLNAISSCSHINIDKRESQNRYPTTGAQIVLHKNLTVSPNRAGLYLQEGKITGGAHSRFEPFCYIRFWNVAKSQRLIQADTFVVKQSRIETRLIVQQDKPLKNFPELSFRLVDSTPSDILEVVTMRIHSVKQPDVYLLECGGVENIPSEIEPPSMSDIRNAMGNIMSIKH